MIKLPLISSIKRKLYKRVRIGKIMDQRRRPAPATVLPQGYRTDGGVTGGTSSLGGSTLPYVPSGYQSKLYIGYPEIPSTRDYHFLAGGAGSRQRITPNLATLDERLSTYGDVRFRFYTLPADTPLLVGSDAGILPAEAQNAGREVSIPLYYALVTPLARDKIGRNQFTVFSYELKDGTKGNYLATGMWPQAPFIDARGTIAYRNDVFLPKISTNTLQIGSAKLNTVGSAVVTPLGKMKPRSDRFYNVTYVHIAAAFERTGQIPEIDPKEYPLFVIVEEISKKMSVPATSRPQGSTSPASAERITVTQHGLDTLAGTGVVRVAGGAYVPDQSKDLIMFAKALGLPGCKLVQLTPEGKTAPSHHLYLTDMQTPKGPIKILAIDAARLGAEQEGQIAIYVGKNLEAMVGAAKGGRVRNPHVLVIPHSVVSDSHAVLVYRVTNTEQSLVLEDLNSTNGTYHVGPKGTSRLAPYNQLPLPDRTRFALASNAQDIELLTFGVKFPPGKPVNTSPDGIAVDETTRRGGKTRLA